MSSNLTTRAKTNEIVMKKFANYVSESFKEVRYNVAWPSIGSVQSKAVLVVVATLVFTAAVWVLDFSFDKLLEFIYG